MLTSLKVVRMAAVDCDCTRRSAMRARRRDIGTRCSVRLPAGSWIAGLAGFAAAGAGLAPADTTSPLVTRPSRPVPGKLAGEAPFSAAIFLADGEALDWAAAGADCAAGLAGAAAGFSAA